MKKIILAGLIALMALSPIYAFAGGCCGSQKACTCAKCPCDGTCTCGCTCCAK